jgi:hypothetical protein
MTPEDKLGTLEECLEFDRKRNYQYTAREEIKVVQDCIEAIQMTMSRGIRDDYYRGQYDAIATIKKRFNIE